MLNIIRASAIAILALGAGAVTLSVMEDEAPGVVDPAGEWEPGRHLDGRVYHTRDTILETGEVLRDELHFRDGRFQSAKCQDYCDFGWSEYRTRVEGDAIRFTVTTRCPDAPHTVVWHGTVVGDTLRVDGTWTTRRFYWTRHLHFTGEGSLAPPADAGISG